MSETNTTAALDRLAAARGDIRRAAARVKRALAVLYPVGCVVEFKYVWKKPLMGAVRGYRFNERSGNPELFVWFTDPCAMHVGVSVSSVLRVVPTEVAPAAPAPAPTAPPQSSE